MPVPGGHRPSSRKQMPDSGFSLTPISELPGAPLSLGACGLQARTPQTRGPGLRLPRPSRGCRSPRPRLAVPPSPPTRPEPARQLRGRPHPPAPRRLPRNPSREPGTAPRSRREGAAAGQEGGDAAVPTPLRAAMRPTGTLHPRAGRRGAAAGVGQGTAGLHLRDWGSAPTPGPSPQRSWAEKPVPASGARARTGGGGAGG